MKLSKIVLGLLVTVTLSTTVHAEKFKLKVCERAETSFWDTVQETYNSADHSFVESLEAGNQKAYFKLAQSKIEKSLEEVRKRCKTTDKDILDAYEKKNSEIQDKLNSL
jgi:hypothetical protein